MSEKDILEINVYHWIRNKKLIIYIIIIACYIGIWFLFEHLIYLHMIVSIATIPLCVYYIFDHIKRKKQRIGLNETNLIITKWSLFKEQEIINYKDIDVVYVISKYYNRKYRGTWIKIFVKWRLLITEQYYDFIENINDFLDNLQQKWVIICDVSVYDIPTDNIYDKNVISRSWCSRYNIFPNYAIKREIKKTYRWISKLEIEQFEKDNQIDFMESNIEKKSNRKKEAVIWVIILLILFWIWYLCKIHEQNKEKELEAQDNVVETVINLDETTK